MLLPICTIMYLHKSTVVINAFEFDFHYQKTIKIVPLRFIFSFNISVLPGKYVLFAIKHKNNFLDRHRVGMKINQFNITIKKLIYKFEAKKHSMKAFIDNFYKTNQQS